MQGLSKLFQLLLGILEEHFWIVMAVIFFMLDDVQFAGFSFAMAIYDKICKLVDYFYDDDDSDTVEELAKNEGAAHVGN